MNNAQYFADLLIAELKKPKSEQRFTIAHVPVKLRGEVGHLLRKSYGGNTLDKRLGDASQTFALSIPVFSAAMIGLPAVVNTVINPAAQKAALDMVTATLGGKIVDKTTNIVSNGKYPTFGNYVYYNSGLHNLVKGTAFEAPATIVSEFSNPGYYSGMLAKPFVSAGVNKLMQLSNKVENLVQKTPFLLKRRYLRQDVNDAVQDVLNYTKINKAAEPQFFKNVRAVGNHNIVRGANVYTTPEGTLVDTVLPFFRNSTNTAAISKIDNNTYALRMSPGKNNTLSFKDQKQIMGWINDLPHHSYISGDYPTYPQGQIYTNMLNDRNLGSFVQSYIWPQEGVNIGKLGLSPDAYEYVAKLAQRPGYQLRYTTSPMTSFNDLGAHGPNRTIYDGWYSSLTKDVSEKQKYIDNQLNPWLKNLGIDRLAYVNNNMIMIPHPVVYKNKLGGKIKMARH